jgi:GDP-L-fucose synthase
MVGHSLIKSAPSQHQVFFTSRAELDLTRTLEISEFFKTNGIEAVIMAAARVGGIFANMNNQRAFLLENLKIQNAIFEAALMNNIKKFIFLGSSCIYPKFADQPIKETSLLTGALEETNASYALAKIAGVQLCSSIFQELGLEYFSLMPTNLYGSHDNFDLLESHVPAALMRRIHEAKASAARSVKVWGTGNPKREFMHVDDLASACWYFLDYPKGGELINIGTGKGISISNFAALMKEIIGYRGDLEFDTSFPDGTPVKILDVSKAKTLGWESRIDLSTGLAKTYEWFEGAYRKGEIRGL